MLRGTRVGLRARHSDDVETLHNALHADPSTRVRTDPRPWQPLGLGQSPFTPKDPKDELAVFSVVELTPEQPLAGAAVLWGIDQHNGFAHLGLSLLPDFRGRGLSTDLVRTLCRYGFVFRHLHRLQIETLADNVAMIRAATGAGFVHEGTLRSTAWVEGRYLDEVVYGLLRDEWETG